MLQFFHFLGEVLRPFGHLLRGALRFGALFCPICAREGVGDLPLPLSKLLRFVGQGTHRAFERGAFEHLDALLELLPQPLLLLREISHRLSGILRRQLLRRLFELAQLLGEFGGERITQELLRLLELPLQRAVECPGFLQLLLQLLRRRLELLHPVRQFALFTSQRLGLLGGLIAHLVLGALLRRVLGALLQLPLRGRRGGRARHRRIGGIANRVALLTQRGEPDYQLGTFARELPR